LLVVFICVTRFVGWGGGGSLSGEGGEKYDRKALGLNF